MRVKVVVVNDFITRVEPKHCIDTKFVSSSTAKSVEQAFPGCNVSVWDGELWDEVDESTEALVVEGSSLKVVQAAPAGDSRCCPWWIQHDLYPHSCCAHIAAAVLGLTTGSVLL